jgi:flagellar biosynthesis protein FlhF
MMIRRYIVRDMPEAVLMIRKELGKDAVILSSKRITLKKWMGLLRYKRLEVLAATGDDVPVRVHARGGKDESSSPHSTSAESGDLARKDAAPGTAGASVNDASASALEDVRRQIADVKKLLETSVLTPTIRPPLIQQLLRQGVAEDCVVRIMEQFPGLSPVGTDSEGDGSIAQARQRDLFIGAVRRDLANLTQAQPIQPSSRIVAMVGPTGVGKTTTIAKLAALEVIAGKRKVGLLTMDTFRIAAVDQLRTYANILNVPLEVAYQPEDLPVALERLSDRGLIFIDTAGRNFRMDIHVQELQNALGRVPVDETYLVLSVTSKPEDLDSLAAVFSQLPIDKFLFTKLDETTTYGAILNLLYTYRKPLSYLTTGQNVPNDIEVASVDKVLRLILGGAA